VVKKKGSVWFESKVKFVRKEKIRRMRTEFRILVERCMCSQKHLKGVCKPNRCFPTLYKTLYPKGGFYVK